VTNATFPFKANFPTLYDQGTAPMVDTAIASVAAEWSGCFDAEVSGIQGAAGLFQTLPHDQKVAKQNLLYAYLVAWWLADMNPTSVVGVQGDGGMALTSKSIGGVSVSRKDLESQPALIPLQSNAFGHKALTMIMSAPERFRLHGQRRSLPSAARFGWG